MEANYQARALSPLWYKIITGLLITATFVVFFIILWPFLSSYFRYFQGSLSSNQESFDVVKLPDIADLDNIQKSNQQTSASLSGKITFFVKTDTLEISAPIVEGVSQTDLYKGIGHHPGTPWPSDKVGNVILTGHSSWFDPANKYGFVFKHLDRLKVGDEIQIKYPDKIYRYQIKTKYLINPDDTTLFSQKVEQPTLTVYTCSPVYTNWKRLVYVATLK